MFEMAELSRRVGDLCRDAARVQVAGASDDELCETVLRVAGARAALDGFEGHLLGALECRGVCDREFGLSTTSWVADRTRVPRPVAHQRVVTARKLHDHLEAVDDALVEGRISFDHAKLLAAKATPRVLDGLAAMQTELVEAAEHAPFAVWQVEDTGIVELLDQDGGHDPNADVARNRLHLNKVGANTTIVSGELVGEYALVVNQVLEAEADRLFRQYAHDETLTPDLPVPARSTLRAIALAEVCRRAAGVDAHDVMAPAADVTLVIRADNPFAVTTDDDLAL